MMMIMMMLVPTTTRDDDNAVPRSTQCAYKRKLDTCPQHSVRSLGARNCLELQWNCVGTVGTALGTAVLCVGAIGDDNDDDDYDDDARADDDER